MDRGLLCTLEQQRGWLEEGWKYTHNVIEKNISQGLNIQFAQHFENMNCDEYPEYKIPDFIVEMVHDDQSTWNR